MTKHSREHEEKRRAIGLSADEFSVLLKKEFRPPDAKPLIEDLVRTLAQQAPKIDTSAVATIKAMCDELDRKITEQSELIFQHPALTNLEGAWRVLNDLVVRLPDVEICVLNLSDDQRDVALDEAAPLGKKLRGSGLGPLISREDGLARLESITIDDQATDWINSPVFGAGEMADRLGVARTTLDNWRRAHQAVAFRKGVRNFVYPARQFDRRAPIAGLARVRGIFSNDEESWEWLVSENPLTGGKAPLEWLRAGRTDEVVRAVEGSLDYT